jgi:hypothetical protein
MTKTITLKDIIRTQPFNYNPRQHLAEDWSGSIITWLKDDRFKIEERIVAATKHPIVPESIGNLFALWCIDSAKEYLTKRQVKYRDAFAAYIDGNLSADDIDKVCNEAWEYDEYDDKETYGIMRCLVACFRSTLCLEEPGMCAFLDIRDAHRCVGTLHKFDTQALEKLIELFREVGDE